MNASAPAQSQPQSTTYPPGVAYIDGAYCEIADARISVLDWGFLRSDATYDVVHVWQGRFFRLDRHLDRFEASIKKLRMTLPVDRQELGHILAECVRRSGLEDAYVEMILTRGHSPTFSRDPRQAINRLICFAIPFGWIADEDQRRAGLNLIVARGVQRIAPGAVDPTVKNYHWLDLVAGMFEAYDRGGENVVLTDGAGRLTEGPGFNLFVVSGGRIRTPQGGVLEGITRGAVLDLCGALSIPAMAADVTTGELLDADEVFITSTAGGVMPVTRIDGQPVSDGTPGPITGRLTEIYWQKHSDPDWTTAVADL